MKGKNYTAEELANNPSFIKWVEGDCQKPQETAFWDRWVEESEQNRKKALEGQQMVTDFSFAHRNLPDIDHEWEQVRHRVEKDNSQSPSSNKWTRYTFFTSAPTLIYRFLSVAAIIMVIFTASWLLLTKYRASSQDEATNIQTITTHFKEKKTIRLTDGSEIILAAGSQLSYTANWLKKPTKRIKLKGEAYFSIVPETVKDHPKFVVETKDGSAAVWGTKFSVSTYDKHTQIVLEQGKVRVHVAGSAASRNSLTMAPGELVNFKKSSLTIPVQHVNPAVYTSWASNKLVFDNTPLSMLIERMERTYGIQVKVKSRQLLEKKLSGSVDFRDLNSLIRAVSEVLKINIKRQDSVVYISNAK